MLLKRSTFICSHLAVSLALLSAITWGQTARSPDPTAGMAPAATRQVPSAQVDVTFTNGQLTIKASGAPLINVLRAACKQIGAELDAQTQPRDPISGTLGPGSPKAVLESLLSGAHVNYVFGGAADDPNAVANIAISAQTQDSSSPTRVAQQQTGPVQDSSATAAPVRSGASQMLELIEAAKTELANGASLDLQGITDETGAGREKVDVAAVMQQLEAQLKSVEQTAARTSENQQASPAENQQPAATDAAGAQSDVVNPAGRPMHRKHR